MDDMAKVGSKDIVSTTASEPRISIPLAQYIGLTECLQAALDGRYHRSVDDSWVLRAERLLNQVAKLQQR